MKRTISALLVVVITLAAVPATAADKETTKAAAGANTKPIAAAIQKADLTSLPAAKSMTAQKVPTSLPRTGSNRIRKQGGGGKTGMIIGLVTTVVGLGATVYMVKEMNKEDDNQ